MQKHNGAGSAPSKLTLSTAQFGMPYGIHNRDGVPSEESSFELLRQASSGGITSYDTAAAYGTSECFWVNFSVAGSL
ncbi:hypothetical protein ACFFNY_18175 [Paenibacillus hodogayensis]|uniref:NADP-dependent oxidoreductase domain-containing protein n=1 Tax=Paenibacillus hodogayensis TaxID=279208 RepID=A0ABV5VYV9_9BACL